MPPKRRKVRAATNSRTQNVGPRVSPVRLRIYGVRDPQLILGGRLVADLTQFKREIMKTRTETKWMLVLVIHASQNRLAAQDTDHLGHHDVYYNEHKLDLIFSDAWRPSKAPLIAQAGNRPLVGQRWWDKLFEPEDEQAPRRLPAKIAVDKLAGPAGWDAWRRKYGPTHLVLLGCQVSSAFEATIIAHLIRDGIEQKAQGLGAGCKPLTTGKWYEDAQKRRVKTRREYLRLSKESKADLLQRLHDMNKEFGYYGGPPVGHEDEAQDVDDLLLEYYFDVQPMGEWAKVTVGRKVPGTENLVDTEIPFWNRAIGPKSQEFRRICDQGAASLPQHREHLLIAPE